MRTRAPKAARHETGYSNEWRWLPTRRSIRHWDALPKACPITSVDSTKINRFTWCKYGKSRFDRTNRSAGHFNPATTGSLDDDVARCVSCPFRCALFAVNTQPLLAIRLGWLLALHLGLLALTLLEFVRERLYRRVRFFVHRPRASRPSALRAVRVGAAMLSRVDEIEPLASNGVALFGLELVRASKQTAERNENDRSQTDDACGHSFPPVVTVRSYHDIARPSATTKSRSSTR